MPTSRLWTTNNSNAVLYSETRETAKHYVEKFANYRPTYSWVMYREVEHWLNCKASDQNSEFAQEITVGILTIVSEIFSGTSSIFCINSHILHEITIWLLSCASFEVRCCLLTYSLLHKSELIKVSLLL